MGHFWTIQESHCLGNLMYHGNKKKGYKGSEANGSSAQLTWTPVLVTRTLSKCSFIIDEQLVTRFKDSTITSRGAVCYHFQLCLTLHKQCMEAILQCYIYMRFRMTENRFSAFVILLYRNSKWHFDMLLFDRFNCSHVKKMIKCSEKCVMMHISITSPWTLVPLFKTMYYVQGKKRTYQSVY